MPRSLTLLASLALAAAAGCNWLAWPLYVFAPPPPTREVPAEFDGLKGKSVAVVVYTSTNTQFDHPMAALELSDAVAFHLRRNVPGVAPIDARRIITYQAQNPSWDRLPPAKLCGVFNCDYVLLVSVREFSTREPGLGQLARGRITADVDLYQRPQRTASAPADDGPLRRLGSVGIVYPEESPLGPMMQDDAKLRQETENRFADLLARKFYKHKVPVEP